MEAMTIFYPMQCQSAQCGRVDCTGCKHQETHEAFLKITRTAEIIEHNSIWTPTAYKIRPRDEEQAAAAHQFTPEGREEARAAELEKFEQRLLRGEIL